MSARSNLTGNYTHHAVESLFSFRELSQINAL